MSERVYTVVKGDTLWGISQHYGVDMDQLIALNGLTGRKQHNLSIGQSIRLPDAQQTPDTLLTLRVLDLAFRPINRAKLKLEYDGKSEELVGDAKGEAGPIAINDHAKGIKVYFRGLDGTYALIANHKALPLGQKRLTLTSRKMLVRGNYAFQSGSQRKSTEDVRGDVKRVNRDAHITPSAGATSTSTTATATTSKTSTSQNDDEPGLLDQAATAVSDLWSRLTSARKAAAAPSKPTPAPVLKQTRVEGGQPTQVIGALFTEENLRLTPANEKYRKIILDVSKRHDMTPQAMAAVINAEAAQTGDGEWNANSRASTSSAAGLTQFLNDSWLDMATEPRSLVNQKLKRENGYEQVNAAYAENAKGRRYLDYIYGKIGEKTTRIDSEPVLALRFDPEMSIDTGALYAVKNLETMKRLGVDATSLPSDEKAKVMYIAHHEGAGGAVAVIKGTLTEERAKKLFVDNVPAGKQKDYLERFNGSYKNAYVHFLLTYTDSKISVTNFMVSPGSLIPRTSAEIISSLNGESPVQPGAKSSNPSAKTTSTDTTGPLNTSDWRNPLDVCVIRTARLLSWRAATFGMTRRGKDGKPKPHQGIDLAASPGTPIYAVGNCRVVSVYKGFSDTDGFGATVIICVDVNDLPASMKSAYAKERPDDKVIYFAYCHLSAIDVVVVDGGTSVSKGTKLGETGSSGNASDMKQIATGAHLHFEARYQHPLPKGKTGLKYRVDPRPFLLNIADPT